MQKEIKSKEPLIITISPGFVNVSSEERVYIIIFPKPNKTFYVKPDHTKALVTMAVTKHKILNPSDDSDWLKTISSLKMHDKEYGPESKWRRTEGKGNTKDLTFFVYTIPMDDESKFE